MLALVGCIFPEGSTSKRLEESGIEGERNGNGNGKMWDDFVRWYSRFV